VLEFAALAGVLAALVGNWLGVWWPGPAVALGCAVHIFGDWLTISGVRWFLGSKRRYAARLFRTGGAVETMLVTPVLLVAVAGLGWLAVGG
jgi:membrane-bound metal-dependent hydrolase YbcI (DUF457 family)